MAPDTIVIDVGTNPAVGELGRAAGLAPGPGGVGPVTTAVLLQHTVHAASAGVG